MRPNAVFASSQAINATRIIVNQPELIEVGGNSAGNFALTTGTVEAGAYVYTLAKGKGNDEKNWYLTSKWDGVTFWRQQRC
ncbi:autotransporter outer membrane beta-barrel domain-containing protein [Escherichia coli]|nr:autotransporter outer membrane beta-barrel domain-containing protein [Escherichia coli]